MSRFAPDSALARVFHGYRYRDELPLQWSGKCQQDTNLLRLASLAHECCSASLSLRSNPGLRLSHERQLGQRQYQLTL